MKHTQRPTKLCSVLFASIALFARVAGPAAAAEESTAAKRNGWTVISMKNDWKVIFPFKR